MQFGGKAKTRAKEKEKAKTSKGNHLHGLLLHHGVQGGARDAKLPHTTRTNAASTMTTKWKLMVETQLQSHDIGQTSQDTNGFHVQQWMSKLHRFL